MVNAEQSVGITELDKKMYVEKLAEELPVLRIKMGVSQDELSSMIGLSRQTYSTFETKKRNMTWSVFLSLIFIFDNCDKTHDFIHKNGLFPEQLFETCGFAQIERDPLVSNFITQELRSSLDDQAIHAIETMIMVEYARCNNMSGQSVIKAFDGQRFGNITEKDVLIQNAINALKR